MFNSAPILHPVISWRNIWRNPRRTLIIMTAVVIGVWSMIFLAALSRGMVENMLENGKSTLTGDIQIHAKGWREDPSVEKHIDAGINKHLLALLPSGSKTAPRIRVSAMVSNARHSEGLTLVGIRPELEKEVSFFGNTPFMGQPLNPDDHRGIIVGRALLKKMETRIGKKLVIMSRDTNGEIASKAFKIRGAFTSDMEATEKAYAFITLSGAAKMLGLKGKITELAMVIPKDSDGAATAMALSETLTSTFKEKNFEIHHWEELLPMLKGYVELFNGFMYIWFLVIFVAMGFGIVNTTLMAVFERIREFGLLKALGMKPARIITMVLTESSILLFLGTALGNALGLLSISVVSSKGLDLSALAKGVEYFGMSKIIYPVFSFQDLLIADLIVFLLGLLVCLYPAFKAARFTPTQAMRGV